MAQAPTNLNKPVKDQIAVEPKTGKLTQPFLAWLAGLGAVASWAVSGALSAASAVLGGVVELTGTLKLDTAVPTPANGQIGAGDAGWTPFPFAAGWSDQGGTKEASQFRKLPTGLVVLVMNAHSAAGADGGAAGTLPLKYRPLGRVRISGWDDLTGAISNGSIFPNGNVFPNATAQPGQDPGWIVAFYAEQ